MSCASQLLRPESRMVGLSLGIQGKALRVLPEFIYTLSHHRLAPAATEMSSSSKIPF